MHKVTPGLLSLFLPQPASFLVDQSLPTAHTRCCQYVLSDWAQAQLASPLLYHSVPQSRAKPSLHIHIKEIETDQLLVFTACFANCSHCSRLDDPDAHGYNPLMIVIAISYLKMRLKRISRHKSTFPEAIDECLKSLAWKDCLCWAGLPWYSLTEAGSPKGEVVSVDPACWSNGAPEATTVPNVSDFDRQVQAVATNKAF